MDILLVFACLYMAYVNVTTLVKIPLAQWGVMQYAMVVLTLLLVVVGGLKARQFYNKKKAKNAEASAKAILLQAWRRPFWSMRPTFWPPTKRTLKMPPHTCPL